MNQNKKEQFILPLQNQKMNRYVFQSHHIQIQTNHSNTIKQFVFTPLLISYSSFKLSDGSEGGCVQL